MSDLRIERDRVVLLHYQLSDESGAPIETSRDGEPVAVLHGRHQIFTRVEDAIVGCVAGETVTVTLAPMDAYGERLPGQVKRVSKKHLRSAKRLKAGQQAYLETSRGARPVTVVKVGGSVVDVDLNHPLAGRALRCEVEVVAVREASATELQHGHAHGPGGHQHG